jgi:hypothetical protein
MKQTQTFPLLLLILGAIAACTNTALEPKLQKSSIAIESTPSVSPVPVVRKVPPPEPTKPVIAGSIFKEPNQTNSRDPLKAVPLSGTNTNEFLDIRGVGDSAMAETHRQPIKPTLGLRLQQFDATGKSYKGDLSFINWETTVGTRCNRFWAALGPASFAFISHPDNLIQAYQKGFNLIGLANNHARDCPKGENGANGALVSSQHLERLTQSIGNNWLWHGVGTQKVARVKTFNIKGRAVKVAFASLYIAAGDCTYVTCIKDEKTVLRSLRDADADIRILALHSWTDETQIDLVNLGYNFIRNYNGDIVFGSGPHRWKPVRIVQSTTGKKGVLFESVGNFIHPALVPGSEHIVGRVLFDLKTLKLRQVQAIPINVNRIYVSFGGANPRGLKSNLTWQAVNDANWQSGVKRSARGLYANVK